MMERFGFNWSRSGKGVTWELNGEDVIDAEARWAVGSEREKIGDLETSMKVSVEIENV